MSISHTRREFFQKLFNWGAGGALVGAGTMQYAKGALLLMNDTGYGAPRMRRASPEDRKEFAQEADTQTVQIGALGLAIGVAAACSDEETDRYYAKQQTAPAADPVPDI